VKRSPVGESEEESLTSAGNASSSYRKSYPQSCKAVGLARRDVVDFAQNCGFLGQALADIEIAVGEGLANAVEHATCDETGFEVSVQRSGDALIIEIKDSGRGFEQASVVAQVPPPLEALRGFGRFIMRELMDEVRYSERGTRLRLLKRLPSETASIGSSLGA
jgi:anti-sigma regulatory factor (Ser/Thr protein kinase)